MTPQQHPHPWHPIHQRKTPHAIAVHRSDRGGRGRCQFPDPCACPACRTRWLLVLGDDHERWAARVQREQGARMGEAIRIACLLVLVSVAAWHVYIVVSTGGTQL